MLNEELKAKIIEIDPVAVPEEGSEWLTMQVLPQNWLGLAKQLRSEDFFQFDFLFCLTCIDWKTHLTMVYHLRSTPFQQQLVIKSRLDRTNPEIETVSAIWKAADFYEREVYEMFGVHFSGHPDLRLLILPDGWEGKNPLRKDFEDPVNMIRL